MQYRRDLTAGATYFFTVVTFRRNRLFAQAENIEKLRGAFREENQPRPFHIDAIVILPDHIHAIWTLPSGDSDYSMRWRNIKRSFTAVIDSEQRPAFMPASYIKRNKQYGNVDFGSTASVIYGIMKTMLITSTTIP